MVPGAIGVGAVARPCRCHAIATYITMLGASGSPHLQQQVTCPCCTLRLRWSLSDAGAVTVAVLKMYLKQIPQLQKPTQKENQLLLQILVQRNHHLKCQLSGEL